MNVLIASNTPNSLRLGVSRVKHYIGGEISKAGHRVDCLYAEDVPKYIPRGRLPMLNYSLAVLSAIRQKERTAGPYDLVNIHGGDGCFYGLTQRLLRKSGRFVASIHGSEDLLWRQWRQEERSGLAPKTSLRTRLAFNLLRSPQISLTLQTSDHILCLSQDDRTYIASKFGVSKDKVTVVPNGVGCEYFVPRAYDSQIPRLLMVGTWSWRKGIKYLIPAFEQIHRMHSGARLSLVGTGVSVEEVMRDFPSHLQGMISVKHSLPNNLVLEEYLSHDIFVLPSLFEGMPLSMLEAMATGMPVVVTDAWGMRDVVESGHNGILVPCRDVDALACAVADLIADKSLREMLGTNAQARMRSYTWEKVAKVWWAAMMDGEKLESAD